VIGRSESTMTSGPSTAPRFAGSYDSSADRLAPLPDARRVRVLIAEDEGHLGTILEHFLTGRGYQVTTARDGRAALDLLRAESFDVALLDIVMPEMNGLEVLRAVREEPLPPEVIIITGNGTIETAITAIKLGAYDYLAKPYRMAEIDVLVRRAWEKRELARENALHQRLSEGEAEHVFVTEYAPMKAVLSMIERVARSDSPVLICGESGTGKELIARMLHQRSGRGSAPLVDINCAALSEPLLESELFGHERGSTPDALVRKVGLVELAAGGTLFMDSVGDLEPRMQGKLLRALEQRSVYRVGGTQKVEVNARIVAATSRDLTAMVDAGTFRDDLYYRINTINILLPPLRERAVDVRPLAEHFLRHFGGAAAPQLTEAAAAALERYYWPGNVRELRNVVERAVLLANGGVIHPHDLPLGTGPSAAAAADDTALTLEEVERRHIERALSRANWHQGNAATALGISSKTLYRKIREYGFQRP
jgi:DNA-binding NtrC family response regulator